ncbi:MAG: hypothetical protein II917_05915 [Synergistaceae bacterium]|nr:hypothetical protein [Synergistaceae bacterium]
MYSYRVCKAPFSDITVNMLLMKLSILGNNLSVNASVLPAFTAAITSLITPKPFCLVVLAPLLIVAFWV